MLLIGENVKKFMDFIVSIFSTSHEMETGEVSPNAGPFDVRM